MNDIVICLENKLQIPGYMTSLQDDLSAVLGATLLEIKKSFKDVDNVLYDWIDATSSDYCSWRGVTCDNVTFNVVALNGKFASEKSFRLHVGLLPAVICHFLVLKFAFLDLRGNHLSGQIPDEIGACSSLKSLDMSFNDIYGDIPFSISKLKQLESLSLQGNKLSGPIPPVIGLMQALAVLDLSCNLLTGSIPHILGNLTYTEKLYLHSNKLTGPIPPELGNMTNLHYLELNDNQLSGYIPSELGRLVDLFDLNVANNHLDGPIPENLSSCVNLNNLNVCGNRLNGTIPRAFQQLESMTNLNLSSNNLKGPIPIELSRIGNLDTLDISNNKISGSIPASIGDLEHLLKLNLSNNHLVGPMPAEFGNLRSIMDLDLSNNHLSGPIPQELAPISKVAILAIALGVLVVILLILVAACRPHNPNPFPEGSPDKPVHIPPKLVILHMNMALHVYEDIMRMTENLSEKYIIGYGASSTVYKCVLKNCKPVAIKRLYSHYPQSIKEFETELETVGSIKHRNLVSLQGYSLSPAGNLLFYDYMENGSLWDLLHGPSKKKNLDWDTRLKIALGAAQGLSYLHHDCSPRIIHRDVKSSNILLDKEFEAHLTDFGIAKSLCVSKTHTSTYIMGTIGYIDPEYARTSRLNEKSDVYSFGIVLLELLTGRKAVDNDSNLHQLILSKAATNTVMEMVDPDISAACKDLGAVRKVFQLALLCTKKQPSDRPTMHEVTRVLESLMPPCTPSSKPPLLPQPVPSVPSYMDEYSNVANPNVFACATLSSTSDANLFLKFGEVISQNTV
ncbi:hypothetical protein ACLOJK_025153 [Asimina triloba]